MSFSGVIAHIPVRGGSKRVPRKNLRLLAGQPMMAYAVRAALAAPGIDEVYVNTDDADMAELGRALGAKVHLRPDHLATEHAKSDDFNAEIIEVLRPRTLVMVNPVCPLLTVEDIQGALAAYAAAPEVDTLITASVTRMQTFCAGQPVNVSVDEALRPSQENPEVSILNWAVTMWDGPAFLDRFRTQGHAVWGTTRLVHPLPALHSVKVSEEEDFRLCDVLLRALAEGGGTAAPRFWAPGDPVNADG